MAITSAAKTERLLNLVIALLSTTRPVPKADIQRLVEGYQDLGPEAFERMFERDKDELRGLGIPLVTKPLDVFFDDEQGYVIDRGAYYLPDIALTPDELGAVAVASRVWDQAALAGPARLALRKLEAEALDAPQRAGFAPQIRTSEPSFETVRQGLNERRELTFAYLRPSDEAPTERHVQPWRLLSRNGRWYVGGFDTDRGAPRVFRLSRISGDVTLSKKAGLFEIPDDAGELWPLITPAEDVTAEVLVLPHRGHALRRIAHETSPGSDGRERLVLRVADLRWLTDEVVALAGACVPVSPPELVEAVTRSWQAAAERHGGTA